MDDAAFETRLAGIAAEPKFDEDPIGPHVEAIMAHLGEDVRRPGLRHTPRRFAEAMRFLAGGYEADLEMVVGNGVFDPEGPGAVLVRDLEFFSLCEHHLLPFFGRMHVALPAVIEHYDRTFRLGLTGQEKAELVEYLKSL